MAEPAVLGVPDTPESIEAHREFASGAGDNTAGVVAKGEDAPEAPETDTTKKDSEPPAGGAAENQKPPDPGAK